MGEDTIQTLVRDRITAPLGMEETGYMIPAGAEDRLMQMYGGKPFWSATVVYPTTSLFGTFDTEGMALIRGNKVVHWLYTGSGEQIP